MILIKIFVSAIMALTLGFNSLGWAIVVMTLIVKFALLPLLIPSIKSAKVMKKLAPKLADLKKKYGNDKQALAKEQMKLYTSAGVNPMSGCLPQILQIVVLIIFYNSFQKLVSFSTGAINVDDLNKYLFKFLQVVPDFWINTSFLGSDLATIPATAFKSGVIGTMILPIFLLLASAGLQYWGAKLMMPTAKTDKVVAKKTKDKEDDMTSAMRSQSMYMMPLMTVFIGWRFSVGILLYWFINSAMTVVQQVGVSKLDKK